MPRSHGVNAHHRLDQVGHVQMNTDVKLFSSHRHTPDPTHKHFTALAVQWITDHMPSLLCLLPVPQCLPWTTLPQLMSALSIKDRVRDQQQQTDAQLAARVQMATHVGSISSHAGQTQTTHTTCTANAMQCQHLSTCCLCLQQPSACGVTATPARGNLPAKTTLP